MTDYTTYLHSYQQLIEEHLAVIHTLLTNSDVKRLGWEFQEAKNSQPENPFNVFTMASDLYYRENFHSDVIKAFLDPSGNHNEGSTFLFAFIDFLNSNFADKVSIAKQNYISAKVEREPGKIDILISSELTKHCIIIENKMYNAGDMQRQLPRYYDFMTGQGYTIDAIVYLPLDINKRPDQSTWKGDDEKHVLPLLCIVPAYHKGGVSLVGGWLLPCSQQTKNIDCISVLRQYSDLITQLSNNIMDNLILEKFYNFLLEGKNLQSAQSIRNMLNDIPVYMKDRIVKQLRDNGYSGVWSWKPEHCGLRFLKDGGEYKIDIWSSVDGYSIQIFEQGTPLNDVPWTEDILKTLQDINFVARNERYERTNYSFMDEATVIRDVETLAKLMTEMLK